MVNSWNWVDSDLYGVVIYGGQYITFVSFHTDFDAVLDAIIEKGQQEFGVQEGAPIVFLESGYMDSGHAQRMADDELVSLVIGG